MFSYLKRRKELARYERALTLIRNSNAEEMRRIHEYSAQEQERVLRRIAKYEKNAKQEIRRDRFMVVTAAIALLLTLTLIIGRLSGML